jgi:putative ABC transport system permease protein
MIKQAILEAVGNLLASRQRSLLALIGIMVGAGAVIAMLTVGAIAREETARQFRAMGTDILMIRADSDQGLGDLPLAETEALPNRVPGLSAVAPFMLGGGQVSAEGQSRSATFLGVTESFAPVARVRVGQGRFISRHDRFEPFAVIGAGLAEQLSTPFNRIRTGSSIRVGRYVFTVIGVLEPVLPSPMMPADVNDALIVSLANGRRIMSTPQLAWGVGRAAPDADPDRVARAIAGALEPAMREGRVQVQSARALLAGLASQMRLFTLLLGAVGAIALVLGGVGVMNIMLVSVQERRREIGVRLAIGATRWNIQALFLTEAAVLSLAGGAFGVLLGLAGAWGFAQMSGWAFVVSATAIPLGAGVSIATGLFFGFYPAVMASRLDPIVALRTE